jgi:Cof subfamily protein (haloacid dehalogenase superfamily)
MDFKLVVIDIDGTLIGPDYTISQRNIEAIRKARSMGVIVTLATGRNFRAAVDYAMELELDVPIITYNGALIRYPHMEEIILHKPLPEALAREIVKIAKENNLRISLYINDNIISDDLGPGYPGKLAHNISIVESLEDYFQREPTRIIVMGDGDNIKKFSQVFTQREAKPYMVTFLGGGNLEVLHPEVSKMSAIKNLAEKLDISKEEIIAIGDNDNDIEMIKFAGLGVAMGNSPQEIKDIADYVTLSNIEDGVAEVIEKFIFNKK